MATTVIRECPVCYDGFDKPKILPCAHLVCHKCVISLLKSGDAQSVCPLCRASLDPLNGRGDVAQQVDSLPTDLATAMLVDSQKTLAGPHLCSCSNEASLFCMQCSIKLCSGCAKCHDDEHSGHVIEKLNNLTAEHLAAHCKQTCSSHSNQPLELYCTWHEELVCVRCKNHMFCKDMLEDIPDIAPEKREQVRCQVKMLEKEAAEFNDKVNLISNIHAKLMARSSGLAEVGSDYEHILKRGIDKRLDKLQSYGVYLKKLQTCLIAHKNLAEQLADEAPDVALLGMVKSLMQRKTQSATDRRRILQDDKFFVLNAEKDLNRLFEMLEKSQQQSNKEEKCKEKPELPLMPTLASSVSGSGSRISQASRSGSIISAPMSPLISFTQLWGRLVSMQGSMARPMPSSAISGSGSAISATHTRANIGVRFQLRDQSQSAISGSPILGSGSPVSLSGPSAPIPGSPASGLPSSIQDEDR